VTSRILVTGSAGLIGTALVRELNARGHRVCGFDLAARVLKEHGDIRIQTAIGKAVDDCDGIVHLAAVSRVVWGERQPELCKKTNVGGTRNVLEAASKSRTRPWVIFASSREVYGQPLRLPVVEDATLAPINVYGRTKVRSERDVIGARVAGFKTAVVRLSNVYGSVDDHHDRVIPAFIRAAVDGGTIRVDGRDSTFDFTHIDDTVAGICAVIDMLVAGEAPPPIHFLTGRPTTLGELAETTVRLADTRTEITESPPRRYDVGCFYGSPERARELLGWRPRVGLEEGLSRLIADFRDALATPSRKAGGA
jgi:nucleoside-diphosphate-sugar epimerase